MYTLNLMVKNSYKTDNYVLWQYQLNIDVDIITSEDQQE